MNPHAGYLKTSNAKAKVAHWFRQENTQRAPAAEHGKPTRPAKIKQNSRNTSRSTEKNPPQVAQKIVEPEIEGAGNLLTRLAGCCKPVSGQEIMGYITIGRGVSIHRKDCGTIRAMSASRHQRTIL